MAVTYHIEEKHDDYLDGLLKKSKARIASFTDIDPLFDTAGEGVGIEIWRIDNLKLVFLDKSSYGQFYESDCYIVLATTTTPTGKLVWDLHYWRGSKASIDKSFVCAIKACELHRHLRHQSKQHQEIQGQESDLLKDYFTKMTILRGGTPTALKVMKKTPMAPRLFQIKGPKGQVVVKMVNPHSSSLNSGDVFVLETEDVVYQWTGKQTTLVKRATALEFTSHLKLFRPKSKQLEILYEDYPKNYVCQPFWAALQGRPRAIKTRNEGGSDKVHVRSTIIDLYSIHESKTTGLQISLVETNYMPTLKRPPNKHVLASQAVPNPIKQRKFSQLKQDSMYLLDCDLSLFLWYGKRASASARTMARRMAAESITKFNRPSWVPIIRVLPPNPVPEFWINFVDRHANCVLPVFAPDYSIQTISMPAPINLVAAQKKLTSQRVAPKLIPAIFEDDPGTGELLICRVDKVAMVQLVKGHEGLFNSGYSYIVIYSYSSKGNLRHLVYYWEGAQRPYGSWLTWKWDLAPQLTKELANATAGVPPTCARLMQGKEAPDFYSLFASPEKQLIVFNSTLSQEGPKLFTVSGFVASSIVGKEVKCCASTLSSAQASVLLCESMVFIWYGTYANSAEREAAERVCERLRVCESLPEDAVVRVDEGAESDAFWEAIGGKKRYWRLSEKEGQFRKTKETPAPRVFRCVYNERSFALEELQQYSSQDLEERDTLIVLAYGKVYLWRGSKVSTHEESVACSLVGRHLEYTQTPRVDFIRERSGNESLAFRCIFGMFDVSRPFEDPYLPKMEALIEQGIVGREVAVPRRASYPVKSIEERSWWLRPT